MLKQKEVKSVLNKHKKRDSWFLDDYSVNPYEGCACNCLYCYVRGSKYGENMEDGLTIKSNAAAILDKQLAARARKGQYGIIAVGSATDAYMHHEKTLGHTRTLLEIIARHRFPVFIGTKCTLITRDFDILAEIDRQAILPDDLRNTLKRGVIMTISVSTMDETVSNMLEPGAATPTERMQVLCSMKEAGFLAGVNAMPLLPGISDTVEAIEQIVSAARAHGADFIFPAGLTLFGNGPSDSKTLYYRFLEKYKPSLLPAYRRNFDQTSYPSFQYQQELKKRTDAICRRYQLRNTILP